jgi:hypothetical protein
MVRVQDELARAGATRVEERAFNGKKKRGKEDSVIRVDYLNLTIQFRCI